jgi:serine phosphatase RsbU (regulator of sigma subunit)
MKGIFHSLAQDCIKPDDFMCRANQALVYCLERGSFISATFFIINTRDKKVQYARAGHCPLLYYNAAENKAEYFKDKGIALGMIKNRSYSNFIEANEFAYNTGDIMVLYTDGVTEAKNTRGEQFGYDRLAQMLLEVREQEPKQIQEYLIKRLYEFSGTTNINDDYTTMIVKFK